MPAIERLGFEESDKGLNSFFDEAHAVNVFHFLWILIGIGQVVTALFHLIKINNTHIHTNKTNNSIKTSIKSRFQCFFVKIMVFFL